MANKFIKWSLLSLAILLAGGLVFIYGILPGKVAQGILVKAQVRKPLDRSPKDDGFKYQDVSFMTPDSVSISGWWMVPASKKILGTVLLSHGVFKNRDQVLSRAEFLVKKGYQVLLFDHRGNGLSGDSPVSGGYLESRDYLGAVSFLQSKKELHKPLVFFGFSLGAMSALRAAAQSPDVDAVIADSPLANIRSYVSRRTMGGAFAFLPGFLGRCLSEYDEATGLALTVEDMDLIPVVGQLQDKPVLYFTGEGDDLAKSEEVRQLFAKTPSHQKRLIYIQDAGHEETYVKSPIIYEKSVLGFLTDLRNGFPEPKDLAELEGKEKKRGSVTPRNR